MRILIVEDDAALSSFIRKGLEAEHHAVDIASEGNQGRSMAMEFDYDLVVLDLNLPGLDGLSLLKSLRQKKANLPVMILTARSRIEDRVQCLDSGADDYLVKPFSYLELSARARALLRRSHLPSESILTVRDLSLDRVERKVARAGRHIELTTKEFALLEYLMRNAGRRWTQCARWMQWLSICRMQACAFTPTKLRLDISLKRRRRRARTLWFSTGPTL